MNRARITAAIIAMALCGVGSTPVLAVVVSTEVKSEGKLVPEVTIRLETLEGAPIEVTSVEKPPEEPEKKEEPDKPKTVTEVATDEDGKAKVEVDDSFKDKTIVVVVEKDDQVLMKKRVRLTGDITQVSFDIPPDKLKKKPDTTVVPPTVVPPTVASPAPGAAPDGDDLGFSLRTTTEFGMLGWNGTTYLGLEVAGVKGPPSLAPFENDEPYQRFAGDAYFAGQTISIGVGGGYAQADASETIDRIAANGNNILIFSPVGPNGAVGGALKTIALDVENMRYQTDVDQIEIYGAGFVPIPHGQATISPGAWFQYCAFDIEERFSGNVAGVNQSFAYDNRLETDCFGIGAGVNFDVPLPAIGGMETEFYGGVWAGAQFHDISGRSVYTLSGVINLAETQPLSGSETTGFFRAFGEVAFEIADGVALNVGGAVRHFEVPRLDIPGIAPATVKFDDALSGTGYINLTLRLGGDQS